MKKSETLKIIQRLVVMFPNFKFGEMPEELGGGEINPIEFWHEQIGDMEFDVAERAVKVCVNRCKFVPTAADIREAYEEIMTERKKRDNEIRQSYEHIKSYYPGSGGANYGWEEFKARAKSPDEARALSQMIFSFVRQMENEKCDKTPDFAEVIKGIQREGERLVIK